MDTPRPPAVIAGGLGVRKAGGSERGIVGVGEQIELVTVLLELATFAALVLIVPMDLSEIAGLEGVDKLMEGIEQHSSGLIGEGR